jgi:hypothetical protein
MIKVGINENVYLAKAARNDKGTLEVTWIDANEAVASESNADMKAELEENLFADWDKGELTYNENTGAGGRLMLFPFDSKPPMSDPGKVIDGTEMKNRIGSVRDPLSHILAGYMTKDKIQLRPADIFRGTGIDKDMPSYATKIMSEAVQEKVYSNIVDNFIEQITPFLDNPELTFRLKLPRQSKAKPYPSLPTRFISDETPFYEPTQVPKESSKVKFSKWEIDNGFDKDTVVEQAKAADKVEAEVEHDPFANQ